MFSDGVLLTYVFPWDVNLIWIFFKIISTVGVLKQNQMQATWTNWKLIEQSDND
jgi:hypothetical protein